MASSNNNNVGKPTEPLKNVRWEQFCRLFASSAEFFGNGTTSYMRAYDMDSSNQNVRNSARASASRLLRNVTVLRRIDYFLNSEFGLCDQAIDKQLGLLITQGSNLKVKLQAIREYNVLKGRIGNRYKEDNEYAHLTISELDTQIEQLNREISRAEELIADRDEQRATVEFVAVA